VERLFQNERFRQWGCRRECLKGGKIHLGHEKSVDLGKKGKGIVARLLLLSGRKHLMTGEVRIGGNMRKERAEGEGHAMLVGVQGENVMGRVERVAKANERLSRE